MRWVIGLGLIVLMVTTCGETIQFEYLFWRVCSEEAGEFVNETVKSSHFESDFFSLPPTELLDGYYDFVETTYDPEEWGGMLGPETRFFKISMTQGSDPSCELYAHAKGARRETDDGRCLGMEEIPEITSRYLFRISRNQKRYVGMLFSRPYTADESVVVDRKFGKVLSRSTRINMQGDTLTASTLDTPVYSKTCPREYGLNRLYLRTIFPN